MANKKADSINEFTMQAIMIPIQPELFYVDISSGYVNWLYAEEGRVTNFVNQRCRKLLVSVVFEIWNLLILLKSGGGL